MFAFKGGRHFLSESHTVLDMVCETADIIGTNRIWISVLDTQIILARRMWLHLMK